MRPGKVHSDLLRMILFLFVIMACRGDQGPLPKPRMYPKVSYPQRILTTFDKDYCDFSFRYPDYATIIQDTAFFEGDAQNLCWFDVVFSHFKGRLHCSYYPIGETVSFDELLKDAFRLVDKHDIKANYRQETIIKNQYNASGILFEIAGPVASPLQFFLTDSTKHFLRASLYFDSQVNPDSMAPIHAFVFEDVKRIIESVDFQ